jgi:hypothetical protein
MSTHPLTPSLPRPTFHLGQAVHVNAHAAWLPARVISVAHTGIGVSLSLPTAGPLSRTVAPWVVQPADGYRLEPIHRLRVDDEIVAADSTVRRVAAAPWQGRDSWWVITYASGESTTLPAFAVLRLVDPTPTVTVAGIPLDLAAGALNSASPFESEERGQHVP